MTRTDRDRHQRERLIRAIAERMANPRYHGPTAHLYHQLFVITTRIMRRELREARASK